MHIAVLCLVLSRAHVEGKVLQMSTPSSVSLLASSLRSAETDRGRRHPHAAGRVEAYPLRLHAAGWRDAGPRRDPPELSVE